MLTITEQVGNHFWGMDSKGKYKLTAEDIFNRIDDEEEVHMVSTVQVSIGIVEECLHKPNSFSFHVVQYSNIYDEEVISVVESSTYSKAIEAAEALLDSKKIGYIAQRLR